MFSRYIHVQLPFYYMRIHYIPGTVFNVLHAFSPNPPPSSVRWAGIITPILQIRNQGPENYNHFLNANQQSSGRLGFKARTLCLHILCT